MNDLNDLKRLFAAGAKISLMIRHTERYAIPTDDETFGAAVELTPAGHEMACALGRELAGLPIDSVRTSPIKRCRETATDILKGAGQTGIEIRDEESIGVRNPYFLDSVEVQHWMRQEGYFEVMLRYLQSGTEPFHRPIGEASELLRGVLETDFPGRFRLWVSHDSVCASYASHYGIRTGFSRDNWVGYLQGVLLYRLPGADWKTSWFVPDREKIIGVFKQ